MRPRAILEAFYVLNKVGSMVSEEFNCSKSLARPYGLKKFWYLKSDKQFFFGGWEKNDQKEYFTKSEKL